MIVCMENACYLSSWRLALLVVERCSAMRAMFSADLAVSTTTWNVFPWKGICEMTYITVNAIGYAQTALQIFPFNQIEDENEFIDECQLRMKASLKISDLIYNPFESNSSNDRLCSDFDPDINFYAEENLFNGYSCRYYLEDQFNEKLNSLHIDNGQNLSMCHINIRSMKANLSCFENYLQSLLIEFAVLGITETWLNDSNYDLYHIFKIQNSFIASHQTYYDIQHRHISINYKYQYKYSNKLSWEQRELEILWDLWAPCLFHI